MQTCRSGDNRPLLPQLDSAATVEKGALGVVVRALTILPDHHRLVHAG